MALSIYALYKKMSRPVYNFIQHVRVCADGLLLKQQAGGYEENISDEKLLQLLNGRNVEIKEDDNQLDKVVATCYFTAKKDPLHDVVRTDANIEYIAAWYNSVNKLKLNGIVFYDELPAAFIQQYQTDCVQFRKCTTGSYSIFEERWMIFYLFLKNTNVQFAFFTDASDVTINKDPFQLGISRGKLFVGRDCANRIWQSPWMLREIRAFEKDAGFTFPRSFFYMPVFNAGIVGGRKDILFAVFKQMIAMVYKSTTDKHKDMALLNYAIYCQLQPYLKAAAFETKITKPENDDTANSHYIVSGFPLNSRFKGFETNSEAYFTHK